MKGQKLELSATELLRMREELLMNNYDIAEALDVSPTSIRRKIGGCPREIGGIMSCTDYEKKHGIGRYNSKYTARHNKSKKHNNKVKSDKIDAKEISTAPKIPSYKPNVCEEKYKVSNLCVDVDYDAKILTISDTNSNGVFIDFENIPDMIQFFAWLCRERVGSDKEQIKVDN